MMHCFIMYGVTSSVSFHYCAVPNWRTRINFCLRNPVEMTEHSNQKSHRVLHNCDRRLVQVRGKSGVRV